MKWMHRIPTLAAVLLLFMPFILSVMTVISAYAAEDNQQLVLDEAGKAKIALSYDEVGDELHWQVSLMKAASDVQRELSLKLQLEEDNMTAITVTSDNAQIKDGWIEYTQEPSIEEQTDTISFTTPNTASAYTYKFVPQLQELTEAATLENVTLEKEQYEVTMEVPTQAQEAPNFTSEQSVTSSQAIETTEPATSSEDTQESEEAVQHTAAIPNPLAGLIGQNLLERAIPTTYSFDYSNDNGQYLTNGIADGDTYNYAYGQTNEVTFDDEGYVNYEDAAYLKKSVAENAAKQGLFDVTLDVKGNQIENPIDVVLVIDYSSSMTGENLQNAIQGVSDFLEEIKDSLGEDQVKIAIVAYNRYVYSTGAFLTDEGQLLSFMSNTAESHTGTFIQKGLYEAENLFNTAGRSNAKKMLIHVGDGSANRAYLEQENAPIYQNNGEIRALNGYSAATYVTDFQTDNPKYYNISESSDKNSVLLGKAELANLTLGTAVSLKTQGIEMYSVGVNASSRGEYIAQNLASNASHYKSIDENLEGLGEALGTVASQIDKTISNGSISDPMGDHILLQKQGSDFGPNDYQLQGWRKAENGSWQSAPDLVTKVTVSENAGTIQLQGLSLGRDERVTLTYQIRIDTEAADFQADSWYLANDRTTLDPSSSGNLLDFPIPSVKAPGVTLSVTKEWEDDNSADRPETVQVIIQRETTVNSESWQESEGIELSRSEGWHKEVSEVIPKGMTSSSQLPLYNNQGEDFTYSIKEVLVDDRYTSSVVTENPNEFVITNTLRKTDLQFVKRAVDNEPLKDAIFELYDADGNLLDTVTSGDDGVIRFTDLTIGFYTLKEIQPPVGYLVLDREIPLEVRVSETDELEIFIDYGDGYIEWNDPTIYNLPDALEPDLKADFVFTKLGERSNENIPLENVQFKLTSLLDRGKVIEASSNENGEVMFSDLVEGVYILEEISTPEGYDPIDPVVIRVYKTQIGTLAVAYPDGIFEKDDEELQLINQASLDLELLKVTDNNQPLAGAVFELQDENGERVAGPVRSDAQGKVVFEHVTKGTYYLVETTTPSGYQGSKKQELVIDYDGSGQLVVTKPEAWDGKIINKKLTDFTFEKQNEEGRPLRGAVFELQDSDGNTLFGPVVSGRDGKVTFTGITEGTYQLVETGGPENYYLIDPISVVIGYDTNNQLTVLQPTDWQGLVVDKAKRSDFSFTKVGEKNQPLKDAVFELRDEQGKLVQGPKTSDAAGKVTFEGIAVGTYYLVETHAPEGYEAIDPVKVVVDLDEDGKPTIVQPSDWTNQYQVKNTQLRTDFIFTKVDYLGEPLAGAVFELRDTAGNLVQGPITTDSDGKVVFTGLTVGEYQLIETQAPSGYLERDPIPISVYVDEDGRLVATPDLGDYNDLWDGKIYNMPDVEEPKPDIEFPFIKMGETAQGNIPLSGVKFELTSLYGGPSYQAVSDADGKVNFTGVASGFYALREIEYPDGYVPNAPIPVRVYWDNHGFLHVEYPEEDFETSENGLPIIVNKQATALHLTKTDEQKRPLAGAVFELRDDAGVIVGTAQTSDLEGNLTFTNVKAGTYRLIETKAPEGFAPSDPIEITVAYDDSGELVITKPEAWDGTIVNEQVIDLPITKVNESGEVLAGAVFELQNSEGKVLQGPVITDYEGQALFTELGKGTYYLVETKAPTGYQLLKEPIKVVIDYDGAGKLTVTSPSDWTGDIVNTTTDTTPPPGSSEEPGNSGGGGTSTSDTGKKTGTLLNAGEQRSILYTSIGLLLLLLGGGIYMKFRRKG
ncbi:SpaA isopeptide-forming pilin-related protein [Enterococcus sp. BWR-S5]|uniref:SpaA isopeptide-forming pilin-related protein n=1 Tax=Enterococcus sp. BWR-S5 TaxID=2787714 RepID=UPI001923E0E1|nr:SpaA isopeptide-forming pilin-related protein [Enterococcus sp. BWR-S5]MBL1224096.1 VWA domain-containing protein [Enterococcus sp. BWR-S5]